MTRAYSYVRFSSPHQSRGDSVRRQTDLRDAWLKKSGAKLDETLVLRDEGKSAFRGGHRQNPDRHALAAFLAEVKAGRVPRGSFLIVESLDRLSREHIRPALTLLLNLIDAGVRVVQLLPVETVYDEVVEPMTLMMGIMELSRGHSESKVKSERLGADWERKRQTAATKVLTRKLPGWIDYRDGKLILHPARARIVRRVFQMCRDGAGTAAIARALNDEQEPTFGWRTLWTDSTVNNVLHSQATIGEYQPHRGRGRDRKPTGNPLAGYYPRVVADDVFYSAQAALTGRHRTGRGRRGKHVNLFSGLLYDATDARGGRFTYKHCLGQSSILIATGAKCGRGGPWRSFPSAPFETAVLSKLSELKVDDVIGDDRNLGCIDSLAGELADLDVLIAKWSTKMNDPDLVDVVASKLRDLNVRRRALKDALDVARRDSTSTAADSLDEIKSINIMLTSDPSDETREKLRAAIRRTVESVYCVFLGTKHVRLAAVRINFRGTDRHRDYVIRYWPANSGPMTRRKAVLESQSSSWPGGKLDLRRPADAGKVWKVLERLVAKG